MISDPQALGACVGLIGLLVLIGVSAFFQRGQDKWAEAASSVAFATALLLTLLLIT